jgi:hypothetical protein
VLQIQQAAPGRWLAATIPGRLLVVECADATSEFVDEVWRALSDGRDGQSVLNLVTRGGILAAPAFTLITWDDQDRPDQASIGQVRVIVRGSVQVTVDTDAGPRQLSAVGVSTWSEQLIDAGSGFEVDVTADVTASDPNSAVLLPLVTGTSWVSRVRTGDVERPVPEQPVAEQPVAEQPVPEQPAAVSEETISEETIAVPRAASSATAAESTVSGYIDATMIRSTAETPPPAAEVGDHDGLTVMSGDIQRMRAEHGGFVLKIEGGATEPLTDLALVGRAPSVSKVSGDRVPKLITVGSADQDISRNHVQFAVEGDTVVVTDLHSRNGTLIVLPGKPPMKLRQGEPTSVIVGTVVDLGGGVTMTVGHQ